MANINIGTTDVTRYVMIVDASNGSPETGATITNFDLQYTRAGEAPVAKEDAIALAATDSVHADNKMFEVDGTSSPGLYRVDWPDAAFIGGASTVQLVVTQTGFAPAMEEVTLVVPTVPASGAAISQPPRDDPDGFTITKGENEANDEDSAHALDGTTHDIEAENDGGTEKIDVYYEFNIGGDGIPTGCHIHAELDKGGGTGKDLKVYAYDWGNTNWDQIGVLESDTVLATFDYNLFASHVQNSLVRIRFATGGVALAATTTLLMDQILVEYTVVSRTVGYAQGAIWVDTGGSNTNTESYVDGTADNPVSTIAAAFTIAGNLNISDFHIINGSSITLAATSSGYSFFGDNWTLALAGETMVGIHVEGAAVSGAMTGAGANQSFRNCQLGAMSIIKDTHFESCRIVGTQTAIEAGDIFYEDCHSGVAGNTTPVFDFGGALGNTDLHIRNYSGGIQFENMNDAGTDTATVEGVGQFIEGTCTGGAVTLRGLLTVSGITNITLTDDARLDVDQINAEADAAIETYKLDHLVAAADGDDPVDNSIIAQLAATGGDWSTFAKATDSLQSIRDKLFDARLFTGTSTGSSTTTKVYVQAGDPPSGGADDDYNDTIIVVWDGSDKSTARVNIRVVDDYDDSDPSFTVSPALGFTPGAGDLVEIYAADAGALTLLNALSSGFAATSPNRLIDHLRSIMSKGAVTPASVGTYDPAADSLEYQAERLALIEGSGFSTSTDSLKQIRDAIDTLVAPSVVGSSALSGYGFLSDVVSLIRKATDEPGTAPKYTDGDIVELIQAALDTVMTDIHINTDHPIIIRYEITLAAGTQDYILPPNVGELIRVAKVNSTTGLPEYEVLPGSYMNPGGCGWKIEGNVLRFLRDWNSTDTLELTYMPNSEPLLHYGTAGTRTATSIILAETPTDGTLGIRPNEYVGMLIRILDSAEKVQEERLITAYDVATRVATINKAWDNTPSGAVKYEVVPIYSRMIKHLVALRASIDLLSQEGNAQRMATLNQNYAIKMSALRRQVSKKEGRFPHHFDGDTWDNDNQSAY